MDRLALLVVSLYNNYCFTKLVFLAKTLQEIAFLILMKLNKAYSHWSSVAFLITPQNFFWKGWKRG